uniref:Uncharacterized protein n=1 Tax=Ovis aries TaxID=9940 RepID=A0AC11CYQ5_SHEEP
MDDSTGEQSRLSCPQTREEMKLKEGGSVLPQEESPSGRCSKDGKLLAVTLLLAASSSCLTVLAFCWVASLQAELGSLRAELRGRPGAPQAGAAAPREAPGVTPALKQRIFAPPAPGESNSSQSGRSKRALQEAEETGTCAGNRSAQGSGLQGSGEEESILPGRGTPNRSRRLEKASQARVPPRAEPSPGQCPGLTACGSTFWGHPSVPRRLEHRRGERGSPLRSKRELAPTSGAPSGSPRAGAGGKRQELVWNEVWSRRGADRISEGRSCCETTWRPVTQDCLQLIADSDTPTIRKGIAKLEEGDELQLAIPREDAKISRDGDGTFFGALKLL